MNTAQKEFLYKMFLVALALFILYISFTIIQQEPCIFKWDSMSAAIYGVIIMIVAVFPILKEIFL